MFSTKLQGGKAFATKKKLRKFKKLLLKSKRLHKVMKTGRLDPRKLIRNAVQNMNNVKSQKYGVPLKRSRKNLSKTKNFEKFTIFIEWLELVEMPKDTNVTTFVSIKKLAKNYVDGRRKIVSFS